MLKLLYTLRSFVFYFSQVFYTFDIQPSIDEMDRIERDHSDYHRQLQQQSDKVDELSNQEVVEKQSHSRSSSSSSFRRNKTIEPDSVQQPYSLSTSVWSNHLQQLLLFAFHCHIITISSNIKDRIVDCFVNVNLQVSRNGDWVIFIAYIFIINCTIIYWIIAKSCSVDLWSIK